MRVLVTGSTGHVGGAVAAHLAAAGDEVIGLSRRAAPTDGSRAHLQLDLSLPDATEPILDLGRMDAIVHTAATIDPDPLNPDIVATNCLGTQRVIAAALEWGAAIVYMSSIGVIGQPIELPIDEEHPAAPLTTYHATKLYGENLMRVAAGQGLKAASLRVASPVGPGMPGGRIMAVFVANAIEGEPITVLGEGTRRQNYVDVRDVARAAELLCRRPATTLLNIAGERSISNLELAELCVGELDSSAPISLQGEDPEEGLNWEVSIERARFELGWEPLHSLEQSIAAMAAAPEGARGS